MIGGFEFELNGSTTPDDINFMLRLARAAWPDCVVEIADGSAMTTVQEAIRAHSTTSQFFIYRDLASKQSWDEHGLAEENSDAMISSIFEADFVLLITDEELSLSGQLAKELLRGIRSLRNMRRNVPTFRHAPSTRQVTI